MSISIFNFKHNLEVIEASSKDAKLILEIIDKTWLKTYIINNGNYTESKISKKDIKNRFLISQEERLINQQLFLNSNEAKAWILKKSKPCGIVIASKINDQKRINALYILPNKQNHGYGSILINKAIEWLGSSEEIFLNVADFNFNAKAFYLKKGFIYNRTLPSENSYKLKNGAKITQEEMVKHFPG